MPANLARAMYEWAAGLVIAWAPIACHLLVASVAGQTEKPDAWTIDLVLVALTTSGFTVVTMLTRVARGAVLVERIPAHCFVVLACTLLAFLASGIVYGQIMAHPSGAGVKLAACLLVGVTAASLYFEVVLVAAHSGDG